VKRRPFNESNIDADKRDKSKFSGKRLKTEETNKAKEYRNAADAFEEKRLQRELNSEFDIVEDDESH